MLKFSPANAKTKRLARVSGVRQYLRDGRKVYSLDMLSGWTCPAARDCFAKVYVENGKRRLQDGPYTQFRCFSASQEVAYPNVYNARKFNTELMKGCRDYRRVAELILESLPKNAGIVRYHVGGDFFRLSYLKGAILAAEQRPDVLFYGYTKMINYLMDVDFQDPSLGIIRPNFLITASLGGKYDSLVVMNSIRYARVVYSKREAVEWGLQIDHDDSHAARAGGSFALLLHGVQPKGSRAARALVALRGAGSYNR